jgi:hypothetical protein
MTALALGYLLLRSKLFLWGCRLMKESHISWLKAIAALLTAVAAVGAWLLPRASILRVEVAAPSSSPQSVGQVAERQRTISPESKEKPAAVARTTGGPSNLGGASKARNDGPPWEFELADSEQKVILSGRASVAVQFNNVSGEEFPTVRLSVGEESTPYPILGTGQRIKFDCGGRSYYVSVLAINETNKVVRLRVDSV